MRRTRQLLRALLPLIVSPMTGRAQPADCPGCVLGLYADSALTRTQAVPTGSSIDLWLGMHFAADSLAELTSIEFSISGLDSFIVQVHPLDHPLIVLGTPAAPAGMDSVFGGGGMNVAWGRCLGGDRALLRFTLWPRGSWPHGRALRVKRRYPGSNPTYTTPVLTGCDDPFFTARALRGGTFLLGPAGTPACTVEVPQTSFGTVAERSPASLAFTVANTGAGILDGVVQEDEPDFRIEEANRSYLLAAGERKRFTLHFVPMRPGLQSCTVGLGPGCAPVTFTGRAPDVLPIAVLHAQADSLLGRLVAVEAQPYLPTDYEIRRGLAWIQDASGRGVHVDLRPYWSSHLEDRGTLARVCGTLHRVGTRLEIVSVTNVATLSTGNPLIAPRMLAVADASRPDWEGTYIGVTGTVVGRQGRPSRYTIRDGTGRIDIVADVNAPTVPLGYVLTGRGAAGSDSSGFFVYVGLREDLITASDCGLRPVTVQEVRGELGARVEVPVSIEANPSPADTLRLWLAYDARVARCVGAVCSGLTTGWAACGFQEIAPDTVIVEATNSVPLPASSSGEVLRLTFEIVGCSPRFGALHIAALQADLATMNPCDGRLVCSSCPADGDVNEDGVLTPGDARCAFEIFLAGETVPVECDAAGDCEVTTADATCDLQVTPGDALEIFDRWLDNHMVPVDCLARSRQRKQVHPGSDPAPEEGAFRVDLAAATTLDAARVAVPLAWRGGGGRAAFGAEIRFDAARAEFEEIRATGAGAAWQVLGARRLDPGRVRLGGFEPGRRAAGMDAVTVRGRDAGGPAATTEGEWVVLAQLVFRSDAGAGSVREALAGADLEWIEQIAAPLPGAAPAGFFLGAPRPNPAVRGEVVADLAIPAGPLLPVEARILDVRGRQVKTLVPGVLAPGIRVLRWDRTDAGARPVASGLYVLQVRAGAYVERRKIIVLQ